MIKANYVRVNNYLSYKGNIITVVPKTIDDIGFQQSLNSEFYSGIPLTEEWLLKLGFEVESFRMDNRRFYQKDSFSYNTGTPIIQYQGIQFNNVVSVHQLQNLYFALTGKELTL